MAATGKTPILLYGSTTATNVPVAGNLTNSSDGCEIAINVADKNLFFKDATNTVNTVPIRQSSASSNGWLSSTDWTTFNNKVSSQWTTSGSYIYYNTGNVGIGTATPTVASGLGLVLNGGAGQTRLAFKNNTTGDAAGDGVQLALVSTGFIYQNRESGGYHSFEINGNEYLKIEDAGNVTVDAGNLVIGTSGKGIDFSATAGTGTSELLADYEEGTWSAVISDGTHNATMSLTTCTYTKVGRLVTLTGSIATSSMTGVSGALRITGLPYSILNGDRYSSSNVVGIAGGLSITAGQSVTLFAENNLSYLQLYVWDSTAGTSQLTNTKWSNTGYIIISMSYYTTS